jgi:serine/threonine protein kinase
MRGFAIRARGVGVRPAKTMAESENAPLPQSAEPADTLVGKVLNGRFTVLERIGSGGMGRVYKAMQAPLDRVIALKVLNPSYQVEQDPAFAKRFFLEASVSARLSHPNTITIFDYGRTEDGVFFIAMEYLQGRTLHQVIAAEGCLVAPRAVHIARQMCRALREAHGLGIVHRDLKPANVMLMHHGDDEDFVKVLDFGLVKFFTESPDRAADEPELTQGGVFLGSPTYMAPEQARNEADPRSDVYSLGVVLYHMLAGKPPFAGKAPVDIILKHCNEPPPPFRPELRVPSDLEAVVQRALAKEPADRYPSMDQFLEALKRCGTLSPSDLMLTASLPPALPGRPPPPTPATTRPHSKGAARAGTPQQGPGVASPRAGQIPFHLGGDEEITQNASPLRNALLLMVGMAAAAAVGLVGVVLFKRSRPVPALPPAELHATEPAPAPALQKSLHVESIPSGATVQLGDRVLGQTPLEVRIAAEDAPPELSFTAAGFAPARAVATPRGDGLFVSATLAPLPSLAPPPPAVPKPTAPSRPHKPHKSAPPSGYKDDPYQ